MNLSRGNTKGIKSHEKSNDMTEKRYMRIHLPSRLRPRALTVWSFQS